MVSLFRSSASASSRNNLQNYYLRKRRKWPLSPYKAKWHEKFQQQQAMRALKQSTTSSSTHFLSALIDTFNIYNCDPTPHAYHFIIKTLTQSANWSQLPQLLHRLENVEKFDTPECIFIDLITFYGNANMTQQAVDLFFRIPNFRCTPTVLSLNSLVSVLCKNKEGLRIVPQILLKSQVMNIRMEESSFRVLIKALCRVRKANHAIELLNCMINDGFGVDGKICSLILSTLCEQKDLSNVQVMGFFEDMRKRGFYPGMVDWSNVIRFLVKRGKGLDALEVLNQMKIDGFKPDVFCYTMVLDGVISEGHYAKADEVFDEMLVLGLIPDIYTYNVYINGLLKQDKAEAGIKMLPCMEELGCRPNSITYNTILATLSKGGELSKAREVVREMELKGVPLNSQSYEIMIGGLMGKGEINGACSLLHKMMDKGFIARSSTFDVVISELCQRGLVVEALELLREMVGKNVAPGWRAWEALIRGSGFELSIKETTLMDLVNPIPTGLIKLSKC